MRLRPEDENKLMRLCHKLKLGTAQVLDNGLIRFMKIGEPIGFTDEFLANFDIEPGSDGFGPAAEDRPDDVRACYWVDVRPKWND